MNERTKKLKSKVCLLRITQLACVLGPLLYFIIVGLASGEIAVANKVSLSLSVMLAGALFLVGVITKHSLKTPLFIILIGLYLCLKNIVPTLVILGTASALDELLFTPMLKKEKAKLVINKEIDLRG